MRLLIAFLMFCCAGPAAAQGFQRWTGGPTPSLALPDLDGRSHSLQDYRGKVVLVNFWATWCEPCRNEMPSMNKLRASLADRPFVVLAVNLAEPASRIRRFMEQVPLDFPVLLDRDSAVSKAWRARILPVSFVIGPDGRIRYSSIGDTDWMQEPVRKAITDLLPKEAAQPRAAAIRLPAALSASSP